MKKVKRISVWVAALLICVGIIGHSGIQSFAYEGTNNQASGDVVVTFTFTPKPQNTKEETKTDNDNPGEGNKEQIEPNRSNEDSTDKTTPAVIPQEQVIPEKEEEKPFSDENEGKEVLHTVFKESTHTSPVKEMVQVEEVKEAEKAEYTGEYKKEIKTIETKKKSDFDLDDAVPYIIGLAAFGVIAVGAGASGGLSGLWVLILGLLFKKKKKHWSGLLTYKSNLLVTVKGRTKETKDMQDILDEGVSIDELRALMISSGVETILPVNTKMSIDIDGVVKEFDEDEEVFYKELSGKKGNCVVSFYNGAAKLDFDVTMELV